jgi:hypothetical protein
MYPSNVAQCLLTRRTAGRHGSHMSLVTRRLRVNVCVRVLLGFRVPLCPKLAMSPYTTHSHSGTYVSHSSPSPYSNMRPFLVLLGFRVHIIVSKTESKAKSRVEFESEI